MKPREFEAVVRIRCKPPKEFDGVTPKNYVKIHITDPDLGVQVLDIQIVETETN